MRLFIAVDLDFLKEFFQSLQKNIDLSSIKAILPKSCHLTLKFLGEVEDSKIDEVREKLGNVKFTPFEISFSHIGFFPNENYAKVIWLGLSENKGVLGLQNKIDISLNKLFPQEKDFHPHITLARVKFVKDKNAIKQLSNLKIEEKTTRIDSFKLIKSTLTGSSPFYEELASFQVHE